MAGASVELWQLDWQKGHHVRATRTAAADGTAGFDLTGPGAVVSAQDWRSRQLALLVRHRGDTSLAAQVPWSIVNALPVTSSSLVYTDRSVYRPQQKLLWKVVAYEGGGEQSRFRTSPRTSLTVELLDANNTTVETRQVATNDFGSVAGEFTIPAGRLLGSWRVRSSLRGEAVVRVEEYKRPTFEVTLLDPEQEVRLNRPARLRGEVRYYFGLPVTTGKVVWRVTRQAVQPWWFGLWSGAFDTASRVVAGGETGARRRRPLHDRLHARGRPARPRASITWTYAVEADVTDEGGETRSATRRFRLGFVSVDGAHQRSSRLHSRRAPGLPAHPAHRPRRRAARGRRLLDASSRSQQPATTLLPAEQPLPRARGPPRGRLRISHAGRRPAAAQRAAVHAVRAGAAPLDGRRRQRAAAP